MYNQVMKIGIYGGTFDPVHNGHIFVANMVKERLGLDRVIFVVSSDPPHKHINGLTPAPLRLNMLSEAILDYGFTASDIEIRRGGVSYTVDTLTELKNQFPDDDLFFIVGADMLADFHSWYHPKEILGLAALAAIGRDGHELNNRYELEEIAQSIRDELGGSVILLNESGPDISSTDVRKRIKDAQSVSDSVPLCVEMYSYIHRLYFDDELTAICKKLEKTLKRSRYEHTMLVGMEAVRLAGIYGYDTKKARLAGILHDCAKFSENELISLAERRNIELSEAELAYPYLLHSRLGAFVAESDYGIDDAEILNAIRRHTLGCVNMTLLDKIIYLADKIEPSRGYEFASTVRNIVYPSIDDAVIAIMEHTVDYTVSCGRNVHPETYKILNSLKESTKSKG